MSGMNAKVLQRLQALSIQEQLVILALSVVYAPISQLNLQALLKKIPEPQFKELMLTNKSMRESLLQAGLLQITNDGWQCNADVAEVLIKQAAQQSWFKALGSLIIADRDYYYSQRVALLHAVKPLRIFLYQGNEMAFAANLERLNIEFHEHLLDILNKLIFNDFDAEWFAELSVFIRFLILKYYLGASSLYLADCQMQYQLLEKLFVSEQPPIAIIAHALIDQRIQRGNLVGIEDLLIGDTSADGLKLLATLRFLTERNDEAITLYNLALKTHRKAQNKRTATFDGLHSCFFYLALLKSRNSASFLELKQHLASSIKNAANHDPFRTTYLILQEAIELYQGKSALEKCIYLWRSSDWPYERLFHCLFLYWLGETEPVLQAKHNANFIVKLAEFSLQAQQYGYVWYASVGSGLLARIGYEQGACHKLAQQHQDSTFKHILDLLPHVSSWERALEALSQLRTEPLQTMLQVDLRLIWAMELQSDTIVLEPREQRLNKNGAWSKGRPIALKRLLQDSPSFDYLTEHDKRICSHIEVVKDYSYYGYYGRENYVLNERAIFDAVGHPNIYWAEQVQFNNPVEIKVAEPQLLVKEQGENYHISLVPSIASEKLIVQKTANNGLLLYMINDKHRQVAEILGQQGLTVPASARQKVLDTIASIASMLTIQSDIGGDTRHADSVEADSKLHLHLQPVGKGLQIEMFIQPFTDGGPLYKPGKGGATVLAEIEGKLLQTTRELTQELEAVTQVLDACPELYKDPELKWHLDDPEQALEALLNLQGLGELVLLEWPKGKKIHINREAGLSQARFSVRKEQDWFNVEGGIELDNQEVLDMQRLHGLLSNAPGRFLRLEDGQIIALTKELRQKLDDLVGLGEAHEQKLRFHALSARALGDITDGMNLVASKQWLEQLHKLNALEDIQPVVPSTLQGTLRDYQLEGYAWMSRLAHWGAGACLADDMGLGKTIQALALILSRAPDGPALILAPTSVCINWMEESQRFAPTLNVQQFGSGDRQAMLDEAGPFDLIICSYGILQTEAERLAAKQWHTLVADEAQAIKNGLTKRSKAAMALQANFKLITTGTPIENHLGELWNLFNFINPGLLGSIQKFNERYAQAIENNHDLGTQKRLRKLLRPFILRRLKNDVLTELPSRTEVTLHIELSAEEKALYEALRRSALQNMQNAAQDQAGQQHLRVLAEIMKLRRACCNPRLVMEDSPLPSAKLQAFEELVDELLENKHKALVFSQFVGHLSIIKELLDKKRISYHYLDGSTPVAQRKKAVNAFQAGDGDLFLISLKAGGTGLNLTAADYVIHMDPWWNPAVEDQASDRAHRMGQKRPVTIYRLVAKDTIEDKIVDLHKHKRDLANSLLEGGDISGKLSFEDMLDLLKDVY